MSAIDPSAGIFEFSLDHGEWERKFAWHPIKLKEKTIWLKWYYERAVSDKITVMGVEVVVANSKYTARVETLFDIIKG